MCDQRPSCPDHPAIKSLRHDVRLHAFNWSDAAVNMRRGKNFVASLSSARKQAVPRDAPPPWWPQDHAAMLEAIKQEREEMDTLGYIRRRSEGQPSSGTVKVKEVKRQETRGRKHNDFQAQA